MTDPIDSIFQTFNSDDVEIQDFTPLPDDDYTAVITNATQRPTKDGLGKEVSFELQIVEEGPFKNRKLFDNLAMIHPKEIRVQIAKQNLAKICNAVGQTKPGSVNNLLNIPLVVRTKQNGSYTNIVNYKPLVEKEDKEESKAPW